jgi:hypothetical protein
MKNTVKVDSIYVGRVWSGLNPLVTESSGVFLPKRESDRLSD